MIAERRGFCPDCNRNVLYRRTGPNHILHLLLSVITAGLWLPVWFVLTLLQKPYRCPNCGYAYNHNKLALVALGSVMVAGGIFWVWIDRIAR